MRYGSDPGKIHPFFEDLCERLNNRCMIRCRDWQMFRFSSRLVGDFHFCAGGTDTVDLAGKNPGELPIALEQRIFDRGRTPV
jgi:hypothetical protein